MGPACTRLTWNLWGSWEVVLGQGVKVGKWLFPEHFKRRIDVLLDDSVPVLVGHGFGVSLLLLLLLLYFIYEAMGDIRFNEAATQ